MATAPHSLVRSLLVPYKSILVAEFRQPRYRRSLLDDVMTGVCDAVTSGKSNEIVDRQEWTEAGTDGMTLYYREQRQCSWTDQPGVVDSLGQVVLVLRRKRLVAFHCSDVRVRNRLAAAIVRSDGLFAALSLIPAARLNRAFISDNSPRTIWLSGIHRRTPAKADGKVLTGLDLRDALDPLEDQSYRFSSVRCDSSLTSVPVGLSPRRSRIWAGSSSDWADFRSTAERLLDHLAQTSDADVAPLPILAVAAPATPTDAYDVALLPDDLFGSDPDIDTGARREMEEIADHTQLDVTAHDGASFTAEVSVAGLVVGDLDFQVDVADPDRVVISVDGQAAGPGTDIQALFKIVRNRARRRSWLKVRYESGHTISDGALFSMRYRDMPFRGFAWADFSGFNVMQEKPGHLDETGRHQSLFCWVQRFWPSVAAHRLGDRGWLACDDGAMEIADFVHLDLDVSPPRLSLIHVKAAKSDAATRGIAVSPFEVVTGQAVKNVRYVDQLLLANGLGDGVGKKISRLVWENGRPSTREAMTAALAAVGSDYDRQVIVVQPQVTHDAVARARADPSCRDAARLIQLDSLLNGAGAACRNVSTSFFVVGDAQRPEVAALPALSP